jgi:hypothetical protein
MIVRVFAHAHPDEVAGMVLIDASSSGGTATVAEYVISSLDPRALESGLCLCNKAKVDCGRVGKPDKSIENDSRQREESGPFDPRRS